MTSNATYVYWDERFRKNGLIWGLKPSDGAVKAYEFLNEVQDVKKILDIGCGYGRDVNYFHSQGYDIVGIDFSGEAVKLGKELFPGIQLYKGEIISLPYPSGSFDAVFGYFTLHLLNKEDRQRLLTESRRILVKGGYVIQIVASAKDPDYGNGEEFETDSFKNKRGVIKHFYTPNDLRMEFRGFKIIKVEELKVEHTHDTPHNHYSHFIVAQKAH